ncbi:hypothetical protein V8E55_011499 [Tylopilus felleus]
MHAHSYTNSLLFFSFLIFVLIPLRSVSKNGFIGLFFPKPRACSIYRRPERCSRVLPPRWHEACLMSLSLIVR